MKKKDKIQYWIVILPSLFILVPAVFGYFMYGPLNTGWLQLMWLGGGLWWWLNKTKESKREKGRVWRKRGGIVLIVLLFLGYMSASLGAAMEKKMTLYCDEIPYYSSPNVKGGIMNMISLGGGEFINIHDLIPYKRRISYREGLIISFCQSANGEERLQQQGIEL